ncbi:MAG: mechanosensitive ion channel domain-containing protein, partial [Pseudomonadota bacterium]
MPETLDFNLGELTTRLLADALAAFPNLIAATLIIVVGLFAARWAGRTAARLLVRRTRVDETMRTVVRTVVGYGLSLIVMIAALGQLGVQTTSLIAALGAAGLAIGLALQRTLSNIAAGFMLLWLNPFKLGDYIETQDVAGTVEEVGLFATELKTWDGIFEFVPNSELWNAKITNYSRLGKRLIELKF